MGEELLTLKQVAERLDLPESTLRKYRDAYVKYIPCVGSGRERKYRDETVEVFGVIRDCRSELHLSWEDTERELAKKYAPAVSEPPAPPTAIDDRIIEMFNRLEEAVGRLEKSGRRQEFLLTSLAGELMSMGSAMNVVKTMAGDMKSINKSAYDYNAVVQQQQKQSNQNVRTLLEAMGTLLEGLSGIENEIADAEAVANKQHELWGNALLKEIRESHPPVGESSLKEPAHDREMILKMKEELFEAKVEIGKYKTLYERAREEQEKMKTQRASVVGGSFAEPVGMRPDKETSHSSGGKLFVRGRKK